jgi:hypothetical protein
MVNSGYLTRSKAGPNYGELQFIGVRRKSKEAGTRWLRRRITLGVLPQPSSFLLTGTGVTAAALLVRKRRKRGLDHPTPKGEARAGHGSRLSSIAFHARIRLHVCSLTDGERGYPVGFNQPEHGCGRGNGPGYRLSELSQHTHLVNAEPPIPQCRNRTEAIDRSCRLLG